VSQPEPHGLEFIKYVETYIRPLFVQLSEALDGLRDSRDDWEREQEHRRIEFEQRVDAKLQMIGRDAEEAKMAGQAHLHSHRLNEKKEMDAALDLQRAREQALLDLDKAREAGRTQTRVQLIITIGAVMVTLITALSK